GKRHPEEQPGEQERWEAGRRLAGERDAEDHREHDRVETELPERIRERPDEAEQRARVARPQVARDELLQQEAVAHHGGSSSRPRAVGGASSTSAPSDRNAAATRSRVAVGASTATEPPPPAPHALPPHAPSSFASESSRAIVGVSISGASPRRASHSAP